jgi:hypothetical protein
MTVNPSQVSAARALLDWKQGDLADAARVSRPTVSCQQLRSRQGRQGGKA